MQVNQDYCFNEYWLDYPRRDMVKIDSTNLTGVEKKRLRSGESVGKSDRGGSYRQYFVPIYSG